MYQAVLIYYFFLFDAVAGRSDATDDAFMDIQPVAAHARQNANATGYKIYVYLFIPMTNDYHE